MSQYISSDDLADFLGNDRRQFNGGGSKLFRKEGFLEPHNYEVIKSYTKGRPRKILMLDDYAVANIIMESKRAPIELRDFILKYGCSGIISKIESSNYTPDIGGHIYCIYTSGRTKIGITTRPEKRINAIKTGFGINIDFSFVTGRIPNYREIESKVLANFVGVRVKGSEWLEVKPYEVLEYLCPLVGFKDIFDLMTAIRPEEDNAQTIVDFFNFLGFPADVIAMFIDILLDLGVIPECSG